MRLAALVLATACAHRPPPAPPDVALGLTISGLSLSLAGAASDDPVACVVLTTIGGVASASAPHVGLDGFPAITVDYAGCGLVLAPIEVPAWVPDLIARSLGPVRAVLARVTADAPCEVRHSVDALAVRFAVFGQELAHDLAAPDGVFTLPAIPVEVCP